jgi:NitT/TauT family transport system permease protein
MAAASGIRPALHGGFAAVALLRTALVVALLGLWELLARSRLLFEDVVPPLGRIAGALAQTLGSGAFYEHLGSTVWEIVVALAIGGSAGVLAGLVVGGSAFLRRAFEPYLLYLGSTPKLIFFPVMIMLFGVGAGSKIALGAISCFFPIALSTASGMAQMRDVYIRVGKSFGANRMQMASKVYLPALREPILNGYRLGLGTAVIATLLGETKLSNRGIGYLIIQAYAQFDLPRMYALLLSVFTLVIIANALMERLNRRSALPRT